MSHGSKSLSFMSNFIISLFFSVIGCFCYFLSLILITQLFVRTSLQNLIAKRASDVITQTNSDKQNGMVEHWRFLRALASVPITIFKTKIWRSFSSYFSQNTPMLSDFRGVPITCILFLDLARLVIMQTLTATATSTPPNKWFNEWHNNRARAS